MAELQTYRTKRDFSRTREPRGSKSPRQDHSFVVQKHAARRLHYDLRLELDGVLKSWAVTKGPSLVPGEKRLAVEVEDHPIDYAGFEGTIPEGEYGAGSVIVWDRGSWTPEGDPHKGLAKGHLDFALQGDKLHGRWHLVRMRRRRGEKRNNWLLIKAKDDEARAAGDPAIVDEQPQSVLSDKRVEEIGEDAPVWQSSRGAAESAKPEKPKKAKSSTPKAAAKTTTRSRKARAGEVDFSSLKGAAEASLPDFVAPCLATLVAKPPDGRRWIHEIKFDGYRLQARIDAGKVKLLTRAGLDWTRKFGREIVTAITKLPVQQALIDGEVVVENEAGASEFAALQAALSERRSSDFVFYAFDLLYADGCDLRGVALHERKEALAGILAGQSKSSPIRLSEHFDQDGELVLQHACRLSLEGVVSKRRDAPYHSGRAKDWVKSKCSARQEFVVAGFVPSTASAKAIGSLVLGYNDGGKLVYAGRVGTGFSAKTARDLFRKLSAMRLDKTPFAQRLSAEERRNVQWVRPELVADVEFRGWTGAHILRHASFHGLREDKPAEQVVREEPTDAGNSSPKGSKSFGVRLTHPDRIYWPDAGVTKQGLADYYADVWTWIAPHIAARPLALLRCPDGVGDSCFFQKQPWKGISSHVLAMPNSGKGGDQFIAIRDLDGLIGLVQGGVLEIHPWGASAADIEHPDRLIFDLDPGPGIQWADLVEAALELRKRLKAAKLTSFVKTSGGKGLHVVVPLTPQADWDTAKAFTRAVAEQMAKDRPERYTATVAKRARTNRIFIDYLRNSQGATAVVAYGTRARAGAPVAMPLAWSELGPDTSGAYFNVTNAMNRLNNLEGRSLGRLLQAQADVAVRTLTAR